MRVKVTELTPGQKAELDALMDLSDEEIDTNDIPEVLEWRNPRRGLFASSPSRKAELKKRLELSGKSGDVAPMVDDARLQHALAFISALNLTSNQYEKKKHQGGYRLYVSSDAKQLPRFGYVRLNRKGPDEESVSQYANEQSLRPEEIYRSAEEPKMLGTNSGR